MDPTSIQPVRPPLSQQPPQRIDIDNRTSDKSQSNNNTIDASKLNPINPTLLLSQNIKDNDKQQQQQQQQQQPQTKDKIIPDVDISIAYKRRSLKHQIYISSSVTIGLTEISELKSILGTKKCQMYKNINNISLCVVCDDKCNNGIFAIETVLFIPNKNGNNIYDNLSRFRVELPRVSCNECAQEYAQIHNITDASNQINPKSLSYIYQKYLNGNINNNNTSPSTITDPVPVGSNINNINNNINNKLNDDQKTIATNIIKKASNNSLRSPSIQTNINSNNSTSINNNNNVSTVNEADRDPFDDGFLICTQLVKTGGADQGGLQVGDVFVEFGHYSKKRFPGLKSIANLVRRSAGKEINVVVWRKLEQMNSVEDDGSGRTVFQKLALKLKPLQSHDADGGGVLGAVINTYPLPEMKN